LDRELGSLCGQVQRWSVREAASVTAAPGPSGRHIGSVGVAGAGQSKSA